MKLLQKKRHTNHLAAFRTPNTIAPLTVSLLKPVFVGMPVVTRHTVVDIAEQTIKIAVAHLVDLRWQLQAQGEEAFL